MSKLDNEEMLNVKGGGAALLTAFEVTSIFIFVMGFIKGYKKAPRCP